jgi:D-aminopeptidase
MGLFSSSSNPYQELTKAIYERIEDEKVLLEAYLEARKKEKEEYLEQREKTTEEIQMTRNSAEQRLQEMVLVVRSYDQMRQLNNRIIDLEREENMA